MPKRGWWRMEDTFDVILEEEAVYQVKTVQDLCDLVMIPA